MGNASAREWAVSKTDEEVDEEMRGSTFVMIDKSGSGDVNGIDEDRVAAGRDGVGGGDADSDGLDGGGEGSGGGDDDGVCVNNNGGIDERGEDGEDGGVSGDVDYRGTPGDNTRCLVADGLNSEAGDGNGAAVYAATNNGGVHHDGGGVAEGGDRLLAMSTAQFSSLFDEDGRLVDESLFRKLIFKGGLEAVVRREAWKFLFGMYPCSSTARERSALREEQRVKYRVLKYRWQQLLPGNVHLRPDGMDERLVAVVAAQQAAERQAQAHTPSPALLASEQTQKQQLTFLDIQAQVFADRQPFHLEELQKAIRIIDKDVPRTNRDLAYFQKEGLSNLLVLRDVLITFAAFHPDVSYAQGMNDLLSRFLEVFDSEVDAYWCFCAFMSHISYSFTGDGMLHKIKVVEDLLKTLDRELFDHLMDEELGGLNFCHRWLLLGFQREFPHDEAVRLFEILSSHHLELTSLEADRVRHQTRISGMQNQEGLVRPELPSVNADYTYELFVCACILLENRPALMACDDMMSIVEFSNSLLGTLDLAAVLRSAEELFYSYCRQSVLDCFADGRTKSRPRGFLASRLSQMFS
uniref:TBC1 domain family member 15-like isoform X2 n=1 Tax=Petromyzon marinus TaxID=7757 RepID=A0AAJ7TUU6_PETMA|nr:TBC1 domain family member 15-like isoform X2 [Petromyzon marinus]